MPWDTQKLKTDGISLSSLLSQLNERPNEQAVMAELMLSDNDIQVEELAEAAQRKFTTAIEIHPATVPNMGLKVPFYVFAPREDA